MSGDQQPSVLPLLIAIDFDWTYTRCPEVWDKCIETMKAAGHRVICVTARRLTMENRGEVKIPGIVTYFTGGRAKAKYLKEKHGLRVDIWIDDEPRFIVEDR